MSTTLSIEAVLELLMKMETPDRPRLTYVVSDHLYDTAIEAFKDFPVDVIKRSDTMLPPSDSG